MKLPINSHRDSPLITGIGAVTPLGNDFPSIATALLAGHSGVTAIDGAEGAGPSRGQQQFAAPVRDLSPTVVGDEADPLPLDRLGRMCLIPCARALTDAGLGELSGDGPVESTRVGLVLGLGAENLKTWEGDFLAGGRAVFGAGRPQGLVHRIARRLGIGGPALTVAAACASSGYALALGRRLIADGRVDVCVAGGCDILSPTGFAAFYNLRALSRRADDPARA